ncbi:glycosyltransferase family 2 protein [Slackia piriformis]|uniref:glycosyltransferase family 2 protein n=1 Tax=Slackia piriformis TaxID=626934 RepID=UPI0032C02FB9
MNVGLSGIWGGVLLIIPAYNEAGNIEHVVSVLRDEGVDFVVVNDGSTDDTPFILERIGAPHINLIENLGIGGAVQTGYRYALQAGYDIAIQFDGDGQHDAAFIDRLVDELRHQGADIAVGSRFVGDKSEFKSSVLRRVGIVFLSLVLRLASGVQIKDVTSGFRAANCRAIKLFAETYPSDYPEPESLSFAAARGLKIVEIPVAMHERMSGSSSISGLKSLWYMLKVGLSIIFVGSLKHRGR